MELPSSEIETNLRNLSATLPEDVRLVAVSKFHPAEAVISAYKAGQRIFGESRVQELVGKYEQLHQVAPDIKWHFIGSLQTNKVKYLAPFVDMIQSVDSERLLEEINRCALKHGRCIPILLEVHIAQEESKGGLEEEELLELVEILYERYEEFAGVELCGLMTMASLTEDEVQIEAEFLRLRSLFDRIKYSGMLRRPDSFCELSMGMSGDYPIAVRAGATLVRIGSAIFGER